MNHHRSFQLLAASAVCALVLALVPSVAVAEGPAVDHFSVTGPSAVNTGVSHDYTITAMDGSGGVIADYASQVDITCSDPDAGVVCPASTGDFSGGSATVAIELITVAAETISATADGSTATGQMSVDVRDAGLATRLVVDTPPPGYVGAPVGLTFTAVDDSGETDVTYSGPATITSTDAFATFSPAGDVGFTFGAANVDVTFGGVGTPTVTATDDAVASLAGTSDPITVDRGTPAIGWSDPGDITYGTALSGSQLDATANMPGTYDYTPPLDTVLGAGANQALRVDFTPDDATNYRPTHATVHINVGTATTTLEWSEPDGITYGTALSATQLDAHAGIPGTYTYTPAADTILDAGAGQALSVHFVPDSPDYSTADLTVHIDVSPRPITVTADPGQTKVYGSADPAFTYSVTSGILVGSDTFGGALGRAPGETVGFYAITQGTLSAGSNYEITYVPAQFEITARPITVTADPGQTKRYGSADPTFTYSVTSGELGDGDAFGGALGRAPGETVGFYAITQGTLSAGSNYEITFVPAQFEITAKIVPTISWSNPADITYGTALSGSQLDADAGIAGTYTYTLALGTVLDSGNAEPLQVDFAPTDTVNYTGASKTVYINVTARSITVTAHSGQTKVYGSADPVFTYSITSGTLVGSDTFGGALGRASGETVGFYAITQGTLSAGSNYEISYVPAQLEITARPITVTADPGQTKRYGSADPAFTYSVTSGTLVGSDTFGGALGRAPGENVGSSYAITQGTLSAGSNYEITFVPAQFEITARSITVTAHSGQTKVYGSADPVFTYSITSGTLVGSDTFGGALGRASGETVGFYAITQGTLSAGSNYEISYVPAQFEITARPITVTADPGQTKRYGSADPAFTYSITSGTLVGSDAFGGALGRASGETVGFYAITQGTLSAGSNYEITFVPAQFEITVNSVASFVVTAPSSATAGTPIGVTVTAVDIGDNHVPSYTGTVHFTSTDGAAVLPGDYTFLPADSGTHTFTNQFTLKTVAGGSKTLTATDVAFGSVCGDSGPIAVGPGATAQLVLTGLAGPMIPGSTGSVTVTARDASGNVTPGYRGTVHFTSTDAAAGLPSNYDFLAGDNGVRAFVNAVTMRTAGSRSVIATDTAAGTITGTIGVVVGYPAATYYAIAPARVLDTRPTSASSSVYHMGVLSGPFVAGTVRTFYVANAPYVGGSGVAVPAAAVAVTGNVTITGENAAGLIAMGPTMTATGAVTTINFNSSENRANNITVGLAPDGSLQAVFRGPSGKSTHLIFDVTGYFLPGTGGAKYQPVTPGRVLDTRPTNNATGVKWIDPKASRPTKFASQVVRTVQVAGVVGLNWSTPLVPPGATAVTANVTVTDETSSGFVSFGPTMVGVPAPKTSTVNVVKPNNTANGMTVALSGGNLQAVWVGAAGSSTDVILDITGYFSADPSGYSYHAITPVRMMDGAAFASQVPETVNIGNIGEIPADAWGISGNLTVTSPTVIGFAYIGPAPVVAPKVSTVNASAHQNCANGFDVKLNTNTNGYVGVVWVGVGGMAYLSLDVTGYWK